MTRITSPKSVYSEEKKSLLLQWESDVSGQTAFEILYKRKSSTSWSTLGKMNSSQKYFDLKFLSENGLVDNFEEYYYQVVVYYSYAKGNESTTGKEYSDAYALMLHPHSDYSLNSFDGNSVDEYPLFSKMDNIKLDLININVENNNLKAPLVPIDHPLATGLNVQNSQNLVVAGPNANFANTGVTGHGYFTTVVDDVRSYYTNNVYNTYGTGSAKETEVAYRTQQETIYGTSSMQTGYSSYNVYGNVPHAYYNTFNQYALWGQYSTINYTYYQAGLRGVITGLQNTYYSISRYTAMTPWKYLYSYKYGYTYNTGHGGYMTIYGATGYSTGQTFIYYQAEDTVPHNYYYQKEYYYTGQKTGQYSIAAMGRYYYNAGYNYYNDIVSSAGTQYNYYYTYMNGVRDVNVPYDHVYTRLYQYITGTSNNPVLMYENNTYQYVWYS